MSLAIRIIIMFNYYFGYFLNTVKQLLKKVPDFCLRRNFWFCVNEVLGRFWLNIQDLFIFNTDLSSKIYFYLEMYYFIKTQSARTKQNIFANFKSKIRISSDKTVSSDSINHRPISTLPNYNSPSLRDGHLKGWVLNN